MQEPSAACSMRPSSPVVGTAAKKSCLIETLDSFINECAAGMNSCAMQLEEENTYYKARAQKSPSPQDEQWYLEIVDEISADAVRFKRSLGHLNQMRDLIQQLPD